MKLLSVKFNNFKLCKEDLSFSLVPVSKKTLDDKEFELGEIEENLFTFNTTSIIGKNASGKTTVLSLINIAYDILSNFRIVYSKRFFEIFDTHLKIEIVFYHEGNLYRYITEISKNENNGSFEFKNEEIYLRKYTKSIRNIFDFSKYEIMNIKKEMPLDTSIVYYVLKSIDVRGIFFTSNELSYTTHSYALNVFKLLNDNNKTLKSTLKLFDAHISNIEKVDNDKCRITYFDKIAKEVTYYELYQILSSGTNKGIDLFSNLIYSLKTGCDLIIDEIENHFHKTLVENIINLYKDKSVNKYNATLIFTTHYAELLDLFERLDNIYVTNYDKKIELLNVYKNYKVRPDLLKSKCFYNNLFGTNLNYEYLMNFKRELM